MYLKMTFEKYLLKYDRIKLIKGFFHRSIKIYTRLTNINIWNSELMSSGLSNKVLDFSTMSVIFRKGAGAHGIWGNYCVLMSCISLVCFKYNQISKFKLLLYFSISF